MRVASSVVLSGKEVPDLIYCNPGEWDSEQCVRDLGPLALEHSAAELNSAELSQSLLDRSKSFTQPGLRVKDHAHRCAKIIQTQPRLGQLSSTRFSLGRWASSPLFSLYKFSFTFVFVLSLLIWSIHMFGKPIPLFPGTFPTLLSWFLQDPGSLNQPPTHPFTSSSTATLLILLQRLRFQRLPYSPAHGLDFSLCSHDRNSHGSCVILSKQRWVPYPSTPMGSTHGGYPSMFRWVAPSILLWSWKCKRRVPFISSFLSIVLFTFPWIGPEHIGIDDGYPPYPWWVMGRVPIDGKMGGSTNVGDTPWPSQ